MLHLCGVMWVSGTCPMCLVKAGVTSLFQGHIRTHPGFKPGLLLQAEPPHCCGAHFYMIEPCITSLSFSTVLEKTMNRYLLQTVKLESPLYYSQFHYINYIYVCIMLSCSSCMDSVIRSSSCRVYERVLPCI